MGGKVLWALVLASAVSCTTPQNALYDRPPEPREDNAPAKPGFIWVHNRWERDGGRWVWRGGHYEPERPGYVYVEGRWEPRGEHYQWVEGEWRPVAAGSAR